MPQHHIHLLYAFCNTFCNEAHVIVEPELIDSSCGAIVLLYFFLFLCITWPHNMYCSIMLQ